jgi:hypothetical protein
MHWIEHPLQNFWHKWTPIRTKPPGRTAMPGSFTPAAVTSEESTQGMYNVCDTVILHIARKKFEEIYTHHVPHWRCHLLTPYYRHRHRTYMTMAHAQTCIGYRYLPPSLSLSLSLSLCVCVCVCICVCVHGLHIHTETDIRTLIPPLLSLPHSMYFFH